MKTIAIAAWFATLVASASATAGDCWATTAQKYNIHPQLLYAIAMQESGLNNGAVHTNDDGSRDVCMMQINLKTWLPSLKKYQISERDLLDNWCTCLDVGAWVLAQTCADGMTWDCVGSYNARSPEKKRRYAWFIYSQLYLSRAAPFPASGKPAKTSAAHTRFAEAAPIGAYEQ